MGLNKATQIKVFLFVCSFFFLTKIANRQGTNLRPNIWEKNLFEKKNDGDNVDLKKVRYW